MNEEPKKPSTFVKVWLVLLILLNAYFLISAVLGVLSPQKALETSGLQMTSSSFQLIAMGLALVNIAGIVGAILVFMWKKIGFWLMVAAAVAGILLSLVIGLSAIILPLVLAIGVVILAILIWPKMKTMS
jgi:hypothetical protein